MYRLRLGVAGTTVCHGDHRFIATLAGLTTRREAQEILRRSERIAGALHGRSYDEETVRAVYELLSQEGNLVGELVEEILTRTSKRYPVAAGTAPSNGGHQL